MGPQLGMRQRMKGGEKKSHSFSSNLSIVIRPGLYKQTWSQTLNLPPAEGKTVHFKPKHSSGQLHCVSLLFPHKKNRRQNVCCLWPDVWKNRRRGFCRLSMWWTGHISDSTHIIIIIVIIILWAPVTRSNDKSHDLQMGNPWPKWSNFVFDSRVWRLGLAISSGVEEEKMGAFLTLTASQRRTALQKHVVSRLGSTDP